MINKENEILSFVKLYFGKTQNDEYYVHYKYNFEYYIYIYDRKGNFKDSKVVSSHFSEKHQNRNQKRHKLQLNCKLKNISSEGTDKLGIICGENIILLNKEKFSEFGFLHANKLNNNSRIPISLKEEIDNFLIINETCRDYIMVNSFYIYIGEDKRISTSRGVNYQILKNDVVIINPIGKTLEEYIIRHKVNNEKLTNEKKEIISQLMKAVKCLHKHNFFHCDLKPENILIFKKDNAIKLKLIDLSYKYDNEICYGTPIYSLQKLSNKHVWNKKNFLESDLFATKIIVLMILLNKRVDEIKTINDDKLLKKIIENLSESEYSYLKTIFGDKINKINNENWYKIDNIKVRRWNNSEDNYSIEVYDTYLILKSINQKDNYLLDGRIRGSNLVFKKERPFYNHSHKNEYALLFGDLSSNINKPNYLPIFYVTFNVEKTGRAINFILQTQYEINSLQKTSNMYIINARHNARVGKNRGFISTIRGKDSVEIKKKYFFKIQIGKKLVVKNDGVYLENI